MNDQDLDRLLRTPERRLPLAPFSEVERRLRRQPARPILVAAGLVGAVVLGLVVGVRLPELRQQVAQQTASPGSLASSAPPVSPSPAGALTPSATSGFVVDLGGHGIGLRTETDSAPYFRVDNRTQYAVSPDGRLAYWKTGPDDAPPHELHIYDTRSRTDRTVLTLKDERAGAAGFMAWSSDGEGLAIAVHDANSVFRGRASPQLPVSSSWRLVDLASGESRTLGTISGAWLVPLSWDRESGIATATDTGRPQDERARFYAHSDTASGMHELWVPTRLDPLTIRVDSSHSWALGLARTTRCGLMPCPTLWTWPLKDPYAAREHHAPSGWVMRASFRPGTRDVFVFQGRDDGTAVIADWGAFADATPREVVAGLPPDTFYFRQDGSAIVVPVPGLSSVRAHLVDPEGGLGPVPLTQVDSIVATIGGSPPRPQPVAAFPSEWLLVGTSDGRVHRALANGTPSGPSWKVCDGPVKKILGSRPSSMTALVLCQPPDGTNDLRGYLLNAYPSGSSDQGEVTPLPGPMSTNVAFSTDSRALIYTSIGPCEPPAPICKTRLWMLDIGQGRIGTPREVLAPEYNLGEVRLTILGPSVFKPQESPNGIRQPAEAGTFVFDGSEWRRYSLHRLVDAVRVGGQVQVLLEAEHTGQGTPAAILRIGEHETRLTPDDVRDERALVILDDGRVLAWRKAQTDFTGHIVTYLDRMIVSLHPGAFSPFEVFRVGVFGDWLVGQEFPGAPSLKLHSYSIADRTFASVPGGGSAVGGLVRAHRRR